MLSLGAVASYCVYADVRNTDMTSQDVTDDAVAAFFAPLEDDHVRGELEIA